MVNIGQSTFPELVQTSPYNFLLVFFLFRMREVLPEESGINERFYHPISLSRYSYLDLTSFE
jgi:hypothetical protein